VKGIWEVESTVGSGGIGGFRIHERANEQAPLRVLWVGFDSWHLWGLLAHRNQQVDWVKDWFLIDIIGELWCGIRLPGLESSKQNKKQEDDFYNTMMSALLLIVLQPIFASWSTPTLPVLPSPDSWTLVTKPCSIDNTEHPAEASNKNIFEFADAEAPRTWLNTFKWKAFTKKNRHKVLTSSLITANPINAVLK